LTCSETPIPCQVRSDCPRGESCVPLGACRSDRSFCLPASSQVTNVFCDPKFTDRCEPAGVCEKRDICEVAPYATPALEVAPLPGAAPKIVASLTAHVPTGQTPTGVAMSGALSHAQMLATT